MVNVFENLDLSCHSTLIRHLGNLCFLKNLYGYSLLSVNVLTKLDFAKSALTQIFTNLVVSNLLECSPFLLSDGSVVFPFLYDSLG